MVSKKTERNVVQGASGRQVSLSKRGTGTFKKVSELCTLCAVEAAAVIFSPRSNAFPLGHSCFEAIMKNLADSGNPDNGCAQHMAEHEAMLCRLNKLYSDMIQQLKSEGNQGQEPNWMRNIQCMPLLEKPIEELKLTELLTLHAFLEQARINLLKQIGEHSAENSDPSASCSANSTEATDSSVKDPKAVDTDAHSHCQGVSRGD